MHPAWSWAGQVARRTALAMGVGGTILWFATTDGEYEQDVTTEPGQPATGATGATSAAELRARTEVARLNVEAMRR